MNILSTTYPQNKSGSARADKYDVAIAYLTDHPDEIQEAWHVPGPLSSTGLAGAHCLFQFATPSGTDEHVAFGHSDNCGCLTQIRLGGAVRAFVAASESLTLRIRNDDRLPLEAKSICLSHLPIFAEYQREMDTLWPDKREAGWKKLMADWRKEREESLKQDPERWDGLS